MVSNLILRLRRYEPQAGRWISRTVLNHIGKEIFVIRIRWVNIEFRNVPRAIGCVLSLVFLMVVDLTQLGVLFIGMCGQPIDGNVEKVLKSWLELHFITCGSGDWRAAKGIWKKSGDRPVGVDWNERVINVHEGGWNYVANSVGIAPGISYTGTWVEMWNWFFVSHNFK